MKKFVLQLNLRRLRAAPQRRHQES
jgi:hypothetical protein